MDSASLGLGVSRTIDGVVVGMGGGLVVGDIVIPGLGLDVQKIGTRIAGAGLVVQATAIPPVLLVIIAIRVVVVIIAHSDGGTYSASVLFE